ncbi:MAG: 30S ribosomal protein S3 [Parcubacteria group bacterium GW2011_GWA2_44_12]|nr:MAG: 30S ribosomal protein S3 [Parcubacteria group bacterium GW2011_GWA2_44_12]
MGHKVHPTIFRIAVNKTWCSRWFSSTRAYARFLREDNGIRKKIELDFKEGGVEKIDIERFGKDIELTVFVARPGVVIGRGGVKSEKLKKEIEVIAGKNTKVQLTIKEVLKPNTSSQILVGSMAQEIERRIPFRRVMKKGIDQVMKGGAKGVKIIMGGRLNGAEIARSEMLTSGSMPLHSLRADIDYARGVAKTIYGVIGIKVWVYKGDVFSSVSKTAE